jgi:hypothetical protein
MSATIFAIILPLVVLYYPKATSPTPIKTAYSTARISICLMGTGALMIGLALTQPVLISGTLGFPYQIAALTEYYQPSLSTLSELLLTCPSLDLSSAYYPAILWDVPSCSSPRSRVLELWLELGSSTPYYICAVSTTTPLNYKADRLQALYTIVAVLVWRMRPAPSSSSN